MIVKELIEKLSAFDPQLKVSIVFDGADRMNVEKVWLSRKGNVLLSDGNHFIYYNEDRPIDAPTERERKYWSTAELVT